MRRSLLSLTEPTQEESTVNLTPLIDVVFVVLITFMVICPLLEMDCVDLAMAPPSARPLMDTSPATLCIQVAADNQILLNQKPVALSELECLLRQGKASYPDKKLQLVQDKRAYFGTYQEIKNCAERAGFSELDLILKSA